MAFCLQVSAHADSQTITLSGNNISLEKVFTAIKKQTGFIVFCNKELLSNAKPVSVSATGMPLTEFLNKALSDQPLSYIVEDKTIVMMRKTTPKAVLPDSVAVPDVIISGQLVNAETREPINSASISIKSTKQGTTSSTTGQFSLQGSMNPPL
ncbi:STN and carboxypeptidase regulatory-like domain-containing protein [Paraflavitalea speifideaquila]|uniref:STN and carboxypeptidase regulatory-like domain-containing protein n=1 Tax=Paraflavitalea speifideaquila TaxID=3076558 RepID=UPI0028E3EC98|nr:STN and carboxypeptidase regulatory-like domain-containing protein [Paraflavitalea speifideiaquila]